MRTSVALRIVATWLAFQTASAVPARGAVKIVLGFMDDEVNEILRQIVQAKPHCTVLAVSANSVGDQFFARPIASYMTDSAAPPKIYYSDWGSSYANPGARLSRHLTIFSRLETIKELQALVSAGAPARTVSPHDPDRIGPNLAVLEFPPAHPSEDIIVVVKSPEMGRQPSVMRKYLEQIFQEIAKMPEAAESKGGLSLSLFGTSGGVNPKLRPSDRVEVQSSVYVGIEVDPHAQAASRYRAVISWEDRQTQKSLKYLDLPFATRQEAEAAATNAFLSPSFARSNPVTAKSPSFLNALKGSRKRGGISMTVSFFGGPAMKERAAELGIDVVDMEDAHIFAAARKAGIPVRVERLVTDPPVVAPLVRKALADWARNIQYTSETYEEAILWGLRGGTVGDLETRPSLRKLANWRVFDSPALSQFSGMVPSLNILGERFTLDPFFVEIAVEFLKEARNGGVFSTLVNGTKSYEGVISSSIYNTLSPIARAELKSLMDQKSERVASAAEELIRAFERGDPESDLRSRIRSMVSKCLGLEVTPGLPLWSEINSGLRSGAHSSDSARAKLKLFETTNRIRLFAVSDVVAEANQGAFPLAGWVVGQRWDGNMGRKVRYLGTDGPSGTAQDRMFYYSGMRTLAPVASRQFIAGLLREFEFAQIYRCEAREIEKAAQP